MVGAYRTVVRVVEAEPPRSGVLEGEVTGAFGSLDGAGQLPPDRRPRRRPRSTTTVTPPSAARWPGSTHGSWRASPASLIDQGLDALDTRLQGASHATKENGTVTVTSYYLPRSAPEALDAGRDRTVPTCS